MSLVSCVHHFFLVVVVGDWGVPALWYCVLSCAGWACVTSSACVVSCYVHVCPVTWGSSFSVFWCVSCSSWFISCVCWGVSLVSWSVCWGVSACAGMWWSVSSVVLCVCFSSLLLPYQGQVSIIVLNHQTPAQDQFTELTHFVFAQQ